MYIMNIMIFIITISEEYVNVLYCKCQKKPDSEGMR